VPGHDDEYDGASGPPPDPLDRVWFHPSELRSFLATSAPPSSRPVRRGGLLGLTAGVAAVGLAAALVLAGSLESDGARIITARVDPFKSDTATSRMVAATAPSIVSVRVARVDGAGTATGVCVRPGYVLTSAQALDGATGVIVVTGGGRSLPAVAAGADPETDLSLLRVDSLGIPAARLGSSDQLRKGQPVLAVAAGKEQHWVSVGTVTALDRLVVSGSGVVVAGLIDTETRAGSEHSGGVVLNEAGAVVAILTVPPGTSSSGLAVPIDVARDTADQLAASGQAAHGWLGVSATDEVDRAAGGARVERVMPTSPADHAGLAEGDVIVAVGDRAATTSVSDMAELVAEVRRRRPGESLELTVLRDGGKRRVPVALSDKTGEPQTDEIPPPTTAPPPTIPAPPTTVVPPVG
jgi:S1-C subfamily serine protease